MINPRFDNIYKLFIFKVRHFPPYSFEVIYRLLYFFNCLNKTTYLILIILFITYSSSDNVELMINVINSNDVLIEVIHHCRYLVLIMPQLNVFKKLDRIVGHITK